MDKRLLGPNTGFGEELSLEYITNMNDVDVQSVASNGGGGGGSGGGTGESGRTPCRSMGLFRPTQVHSRASAFIRLCRPPKPPKKRRTGAHTQTNMYGTKCVLTRSRHIPHTRTRQHTRARAHTGSFGSA